MRRAPARSGSLDEAIDVPEEENRASGKQIDSAGGENNVPVGKSGGLAKAIVVPVKQVSLLGKTL